MALTARFHGARHHFTFHAGMGHVPTDVAPDVRSRGYITEADVEIGEAGAEGVLISHGDATSGYSLYVKDGHLMHDLNIGGHDIVRSDRKIARGVRRLGLRVERLVRQSEPAKGARTGEREYTLFIDGEPAGALKTQLAFHSLISWSGLDIGRDRGSGLALRDAVRVHRQAFEGDGRHGWRSEARRRRGRQCAGGAAVGYLILS